VPFACGIVELKTYGPIPIRPAGLWGWNQKWSNLPLGPFEVINLPLEIESSSPNERSKSNFFNGFAKELTCPGILRKVWELILGNPISPFPPE